MKSGKIFLHVGFPKTASTFLQEQIFPHIPGILYVGRPYTQENDAFNTLQYADDTLFNAGALESELAMLRQVAGNKALLVSDEMFSGLGLNGLHNCSVVANRLSEYVPEAEVILFLRGQSELVESLYNQWVKLGWGFRDLNGHFLYEHGGGLAFQDWVPTDPQFNLNNRRFQFKSLYSTSHFLYARLLSLYEKCFSKVHVFLHEDFRQNQAEALQRLGDIMSVKIPRPGGSAPLLVNERLSERLLHQKKMGNRLRLVFPDRGSSHHLREFLAKSASMMLKKQSKADRQNYVVDLLRRGGVFADNQRLNAARNLGMETYPEQYFGEA